MRTTLKIFGMTCPTCARDVEHALLAVKGVQSVEVHRRAQTAFVYSPTAPVAAMIAALRAAGYGAFEEPREARAS